MLPFTPSTDGRIDRESTRDGDGDGAIPNDQEPSRAVDVADPNNTDRDNRDDPRC